MNDWICGMDVSTLLEVEECGGRFSDKGAPGDAMEILHRHGMNLVRLRLWNDMGVWPGVLAKMLELGIMEEGSIVVDSVRFRERK